MFSDRDETCSPFVIDDVDDRQTTRFPDV